MQEKDDKENEKHPMDMTTDEALDYALGSELAEELKKQLDCDNSPEPQQNEH